MPLTRGEEDLRTISKPAMAMHTYYPNICEAEAAITCSEGQPWLHGKFEANLNYNRRPYFQTMKVKQSQIAFQRHACKSEA